MTAAPRAINCTTCGAGQTIPGGGRIATHVCPYCGSALDAHDDFKVLARYTDLKRPDTPLTLGDTGQIRGVAFTVIGIAGWVEEWGSSRWTWTDHQIFSPTHGYGWLTREYGGRWTFTRKLRQYPRHWLKPTAVERAESRPHLWLGNERLAYFETSTARIDYLEGAFNWQPRIGDTTTVITLLGGDRMISLSGFGKRDEHEVEETRLLSAAERESFGLDPTAGDNCPHPLTIAGQWVHHQFVVATCVVFIGLSGLVGAVTNGVGGHVLVDTGRLKVTDLPAEFTFDAPDYARLIKAQVYTDVSNGWAYFDIGLENDEGDLILEGGREVSFYTGYDSDGRWSEGSTRGSLTFEVPGPDSYTLSIEMPEFGSGTGGLDRTNSVFEARITAHRFSWRPFGATAAIFAALLGLTLFWEWTRTKRRFAGSDWTDED